MVCPSLVDDGHSDLADDADGGEDDDICFCGGDRSYGCPEKSWKCKNRHRKQIESRRGFLRCAPASTVQQLSFPVFVMALMSFVGWILFVFFGGLGIVGIPIDSLRVSERKRFVRHTCTLEMQKGVIAKKGGIQRTTLTERKN